MSAPTEPTPASLVSKPMEFTGVRLKPETIAALKATATAAGKSFSGLVREILEAEVDSKASRV